MATGSAHAVANERVPGQFCKEALTLWFAEELTISEALHDDTLWYNTCRRDHLHRCSPSRAAMPLSNQGGYQSRV